MTDKTRVTLIFTPNELDAFSVMQAREETMKVQPLSLMYVASILEREGVEVDLIDMPGEKLGFETVLERIRNFRPDLLGFTLSTYSFRPILTWIQRFKEATGLPVLAGGVHATVYPAETMHHEAIDYIVFGEAEVPLPEFICAFMNGRNFDGIKSIGYRKDGRVVLDRTHRVIDNLDEVPFPVHHHLKPELYGHVFSDRKNFTPIISSRGCPYRCSFCDLKRRPYRWRSTDNFIEEIVYNYNEFGMREFDIYDSTFTANRKRVIEFCERLAALDIDVTFTIRSRVDSITPPVVDALAAAGCHTIMYGVESSNPAILKQMNKNITPEKIQETLNYSYEKGIGLLGFFMFGYPGETRQTMEDTLNFAMKLPLDYAQFTTLVPFPDTEIYEYYMENGVGDYWSEYTLDPWNTRPLPLLGTVLSRAEVDEFVDYANRKFYFRPKIIWRHARATSSLRELGKKAKAAAMLLAGTVGKNTASKQQSAAELQQKLGAHLQ